MPQWDPGTYLAFADERGRAFTDLVARVTTEADTVVDLGCGPGHLTPVLRARWPDAAIVGVDSSPQMVARAEHANADPRVTYEMADLTTWTAAEPVDLVVSNATLQWVPDQLEVLLRLRDLVAPAGALAFQVPNNNAEPNHVLLREIAAREPYASDTAGVSLTRGGDAEFYLDLLSSPGWSLDVWETTYLHVLPGDDPVFDWMAGTGARPVLQALPDDLRASFEREYAAALREAYPPRSYGTVLRFPRVFVVATRTEEPR